MLFCATEVNKFPNRTEPENKIKEKEVTGGFYISQQTQV